jgi:hypothetical protein
MKFMDQCGISLKVVGDLPYATEMERFLRPGAKAFPNSERDS